MLSAPTKDSRKNTGATQSTPEHKTRRESRLRLADWAAPNFATPPLVSVQHRGCSVAPQKTIGNQAILRMLKSRALQAKLRVGQLFDPYEREADRIAEEVMRMPVPASEAHDQIFGNDENEGEGLLREGQDFFQTGAPLSFGHVLHSYGQPLDPSIREFMEPRFGQSFADVRIVINRNAADSARWMGAEAYTVGRYIVFAPERFAPKSRSGQQLLAHELAHVIQQQNGGPRIQRQPAPRRQVLDKRYRLFINPRDSNYHSDTGDYELSPWELRHLVRLKGFYFIVTDVSRSLITPPEVRRTALSTAALWITFSNSDYAQFLIDPLAAVRMAARRDLGINVFQMTRAVGPDQDFSVPSIPGPVAQALAAGRDPAAQAAREKATTVRQERTLRIASQRGENLPMRELTWSERMSPGRLSSMPAAGRASWYIDRLGSLQAQLFESAKRHHIPMQLLAVIILNELADINFVDVFQSGRRAFLGSLGIAQIQVATAIRHKLVDVEPGLSWLSTRRQAAQQLQIPQVAIEAAAREIEILLNRMGQNRNHPWQQQHHFVARGAEGEDIYNHIGAQNAAKAVREGLLARMVAAAYNSPDIIVTHDSGVARYRNAHIHGENAQLRALDLFRFGLFRTQAPTVQTPPLATMQGIRSAPVDRMRFNGSKLTLEGEAPISVEARSGLLPKNPKNPDHRDHTDAASQAIPNVGPIPEGSYYLRPDDVEVKGFSRRIWGPLRIPIRETTLTKVLRKWLTRRTGGFFIHQDLDRDGTAGCIGLQSLADTKTVFTQIVQTPKEIPLEVAYPSIRSQPMKPQPMKPRH